MKLLIKVLFLFTLSTSFAQEVSTSQAINIIGKQCMLAQRMAKDKVFFYETKNSTSLSRELTKSVIQFEQNISILVDMPIMAEIHNKIKTMELLWIGYKQNILEKSNTANSLLVEYNPIMLNACQNIQKMLLERAQRKNEYPYSTKKPKLIGAFNATNDIKYLSQQLSFYYNSYFYKVSKYDKRIFNSIIEKIDTKINTTIAVKKNDPILGENIDTLEYDWKNIKAILANVLASDFISVHSSPDPLKINAACNAFLKDADSLIRSYKSTSDINQ